MKTEYFLKKIKKNFPELKWRKHKHITSGWDHDVIILDEKIVFRFPKSKEYTTKLKNEVQLLNCLNNKVKAGIPKYEYVAKDKSIAGYKMLSGREVSPSRFQRFSRADKNTIIKQLAEFISIMHATPKSTLAKYKVQTENKTTSYKKLVRDTKKIIFPKLGEKDIQFIEEYFIDLKHALARNYSNTLVHSDLTWEHILWDAKKRKVNIIDFSDCAYGDPAIDFTGLLAYGVQTVEKIIKLYHGNNDNRILERSQLYSKRIPLFIMKDSSADTPCTFENGYNIFKERFDSNI